MKIAYLTSGAAGMFCGSCMHDNSLAAALSRSGVDCQLIPTYTPIRTDETDVSVDQVFFGGINIYLQQKVPLFRHVPRFLDRFLDNPRLIRRVTNRSTSIDPKELGALTVSMLKGEGGFQRKEVKRLCHWLEHSVKPDVLILSNLLIGGCIPAIHNHLGIPTIVTLQGDDIFLESLPQPHRDQALAEMKRLNKVVDLFLVHSQYYGDTMSELLDLPRDRVAVSPLGIDSRDFEHATHKPTTSQTPTIGYLARLAPEKGFDRLVDAFIQLRQQQSTPYRLRVAGWLGDHQQDYAQEQFQKLNDAGLQDDFAYVGSIDRHKKVEFLETIDLLCVPTRYREPKGLFALEAMACGIPVLLPDHGGFPEMIADTGGGRLFPADNDSSLVSELANLLADADARQDLGTQGRTAVLERRNSIAMAQQTLELIHQRLGISPTT